MSYNRIRHKTTFAYYQELYTITGIFYNIYGLDLVDLDAVVIFQLFELYRGEARDFFELV